jgi:hypothetical protein
MSSQLAGLLAVCTASAMLAAAVVGPVLGHLKAVSEKRHPIITPFQRVYLKGQELGEVD